MHFDKHKRIIDQLQLCRSMFIVSMQRIRRESILFSTYDLKPISNELLTCDASIRSSKYSLGVLIRDTRKIHRVFLGSLDDVTNIYTALSPLSLEERIDSDVFDAAQRFMTHRRTACNATRIFKKEVVYGRIM